MYSVILVSVVPHHPLFPERCLLVALMDLEDHIFGKGVGFEDIRDPHSDLSISIAFHSYRPIG